MLAGPTASGKSGLALVLAERYGLEVITADSMQVYVGMDIGTAKPTASDRARVPHHLLDVITPDEPFSVADYVHLAEDAISSVMAAGSTPFVVGGTGFYLRALRQGLPTVPTADPSVQAPLWHAVEEGRLEELVAELTSAAPGDALRAGRNPRRVVRSLEVLRRTGKPPSAYPLRPPRHDYALAILMPHLPLLEARIRARAEEMFSAGLVGEVRGLLQQYESQPTALQAIGYKEVVDHVSGLMSEAEALEAVVLATRQYAKRQLTWFRKEPDATVIRLAGEEALPPLAGWLEGLLQQVA